jgi:hypothetical protein
LKSAPRLGPHQAAAAKSSVLEAPKNRHGRLLGRWRIVPLAEGAGSATSFSAGARANWGVTSTSASCATLKIKPMVIVFSSTDMLQFGEWCGWTLARAHARSGEPAMIGGYLGTKDTFDKAIAAFSIAYADQTERDYEYLKKAAQRGKLDVEMER